MNKHYKQNKNTSTHIDIWRNRNQMSNNSHNSFCEFANLYKNVAFRFLIKVDTV